MHVLVDMGGHVWDDGRTPAHHGTRPSPQPMTTRRPAELGPTQQRIMEMIPQTWEWFGVAELKAEIRNHPPVVTSFSALPSVLDSLVGRGLLEKTSPLVHGPYKYRRLSR